MHALSILYNGQGPFVAGSALTGGLGLHLFNTHNGFVCMHVLVKAASGDYTHYWLPTICPNDCLEITYRSWSQEDSENISALEACKRIEDSYQIPNDHRIGIDFEQSGQEKIRLSYPTGGGFEFFFANIKPDLPRCNVVASNESEEWNWQLSDLFDGASMTLTFVETTWNTNFPRISKV